MKNPWKKITIKDLHHYLIGPQLEALIDYASIPGGPDIVPNLIEDTISRVRAEVHGKVKNTLDDHPFTIPPEVRAETIYLILEALQTRVPGLFLTTEQKERAHNAREFLKRISKGEVAISKPMASDNENTYSDDWFFGKYPPIDLFSKRVSSFCRESLRRL